MSIYQTIIIVPYHHSPPGTSPTFSSNSLLPPGGHGTALRCDRHVLIKDYIVSGHLTCQNSDKVEERPLTFNAFVLLHEQNV